MISIIVPFYNAGKYLEKCIKSICNQTYSNIEIILIDDGSKDNSHVICDKFAAEDKRIKWYIKKMEAFHLHETGDWMLLGENILHLLTQMIDQSGFA